MAPKTDWAPTRDHSHDPPPLTEEQKAQRDLRRRQDQDERDKAKLAQWQREADEREKAREADLPLKDYIESVKRDLAELERYWNEAGLVWGSAYSAAFWNHHDSLPTELAPPKDDQALLSTLTRLLAGRGGLGQIFGPVGAAVAIYFVRQDLQLLLHKIFSNGPPASPQPLNTTEFFATPLEYQNNCKLYFSSLFGEFQKACDKLLDVMAGITESVVKPNHDIVDSLIDRINDSGLAPAPRGYMAWDNSHQLRREMEIAMWQVWVLKLLDEKFFLLASELDLTKPIQRMAQLKLVDGRIVATGGQRVAMSAELQLLKWAKSYQPKTVVFMGQAPFRWSQFLGN